MNTMFITRSLAAVSATLIAFLICNPAAGAERPSAAPAIAALNKEFEQAFSKGDVGTLVGQYTKDPIVFREGKPTAKTRKELEAMWKENVAEGGKRAVVQTIEVQQAGDWAHETGKFLIKNSKSETEYAGNYILIWKYEDGKWKIHREIGTSDPSVQRADIRPQIEAAEQRFTSAFNRHDHVAVAAMFTTDAQCFPPQGGPLRGREAIANFWKMALSADGPSHSAQTLEVINLGEMAHEIGTYALHKAGRKVEEGKYSVLWKQEGGEWKIFRDIWNTDLDQGKPE